MTGTGIFAALGSAKRAVLPSGLRFRRIIFGPAAGCVMQIDLHHHIRHLLGVYESELTPYLMALIRPGSRCFDGAEGPVGDRDDDRHITIDRAARRYFAPDFIKIDIEGEQEQALRGAAGVLAKRQPHLIVETQSAPLEEACLGLVRSHGYSPCVVERRRWLREHRPATHNRGIVCRRTAR